MQAMFQRITLMNYFVLHVNYDVRYVVIIPGMLFYWIDSSYGFVMVGINVTYIVLKFTVVM